MIVKPTIHTSWNISETPLFLLFKDIHIFSDFRELPRVILRFKFDHFWGDSKILKCNFFKVRALFLKYGFSLLAS